ncbi:serine hydrolase [Marmoricola endophyticus]|uniref:Serine hydrolase n=1 Tax=Marmoricola endophyticus TaxID=2040280 RepID=A0A917BTD5_9ACTN|nr:serine hydrolase domain-containing protein [Marmoricola endophyticus]GGF55979.1 serine hydrolase [Marmoricola endophyticus]
MTQTLRTETARELRRLALDRQRRGRVPGLAAGVVRRGELVWHDGIGTVDVAHPRVPGPDDQFLIASNTKTFTAVLIMQLRDEGRLALDDELADHVPGLSGQGATIRQALSHATGLQREPAGDVWANLEMPDDDALVRGFGEIERIGPPCTRWHYSNVLYAVLGQVVAHVDGRPWEDALQRRLLDPLGMTRTTVGFDDGPRATGYYVPAYDDVPRVEPVLAQSAMAPCGGLASTVTDLAAWSGFVAAPDPAVLSPDTMEEMCHPRLVVDTDGWRTAMGLGFWVHRAVSGRTYVGHTGGMPGQISGVFTDRESGTGGIVLMNQSTSPDPMEHAVALADHVVQHDPVEPEPWTPGTEVPSALRPVLGRWFTEGSAFTFSVRQGHLEARAEGAPADRAPSVFAPLEGEPDTYRTVSGRERGERLRLVRDADGQVSQMYWATYVVTREPLAFGEHLRH